LKLNPETRRKRVSDLHVHSPRSRPAYLTGCWILDELREEQRDAKFACAHEVGDPRIGDLLRVRDSRTQQQSYHNEWNPKTFFHGTSLQM
jgi:hypothetical protein